MLFISLPKYISMAYYIMFLWIPQNVTQGKAKPGKVTGHFFGRFTL